MKFCKNCGHELRDDAKICTNCGTPVTESPDTQQTQTTPLPPKKPVEKREPMDPEKKKKYLIITGSILGAILLLIIAFFVLKALASPNSKIDSIEEAVTNNNIDAFKKSIDTKITDTEAEAYLLYVHEEIGIDNYKKAFENLKNQIRRKSSEPAIYNGANAMLVAEKDGKKYLFFDDYSFVIPRKNIKIEKESDITELIYSYDGKKSIWKNGGKFQELIPGSYYFPGTGILANEAEVDSGMSVIFHPESEQPETRLIENYYFFDLYNDYWQDNILNAISSMKLQLNGEDIDFNPENEKKYGPLEFDTDYEITGEMVLHGQKIAMKPIIFNMTEQDAYNYAHDFDDYERKATFLLEFNEDDIIKAIEEQDKKEQAESDYKYFKENARSEIESFISSYLYALERMYEDFDIGEVEEYIEKDSDVEKTLKNNIANKNFKNMYIYNVSYSNFEEDGDNYTIDVKSKRDFDGLEEAETFNTRYGVKYDKKTNKLILTSFTDL